MPYLSKEPRMSGNHVFFNDQVFVFPDRDAARHAAGRLAVVNKSGNLWALVDLAGQLQILQTKTGRRPGLGN